MTGTRIGLVFAAMGLMSGVACGQGPLKVVSKTAKAGPALTVSEAKASRAFDAVKGHALGLHAFLAEMPKGADLHVHLSGAVYAETFLREAAADNMCVNPETLSFVSATAPVEGKPMRSEADICVAPTVKAKAVLANQTLYDALVDSFSMRSFVATPGVSGHDQFFNTFARFGGLDAHSGEWLDEVATRAAAQNEQYLEVMITPGIGRAFAAASRVKWPGEHATAAQMAAVRDQMIANGLKDDVAADVKVLGGYLAERGRLERCGTADAAPACGVTIRVIFQVLRAFGPAAVFAQTVIGFEAAMADPRVVGINYVQPEDAYMAMSEYHRQMQMLDYLHGAYPKVHISLHAGEIAPGLVPPEGLRFHIREAVELGHAERIGHGVDVMYEDRPRELLKEMAEKHVMVEINLTSNDKILGVMANDHSLPSYRAAGVPVALSTDDEGVSRIDLTHEYARAVVDYGLSYRELKDMARTGIAHSFLPGESLWAAPDVFGKMAGACAGAKSSAPAAGGCAEFLKGSEKAAQEWELERRFAVFEGNLP